MNPEIRAQIASRYIPLDQTCLGLRIEMEEVERFYEPLASWILAQAGDHSRTLVAMAGPPGSGKSAVAAILKIVIDVIAEAESSIVIGMDGWHFPNDFLDRTTIQMHGQTVLLRKIKGSPETFDVKGINTFLHEIIDQSSPTFPIYSRLTHDPIAAAGRIEDRHRILILEGNYLLLDAERWRDLYPRFDLKIFIDAPIELLKTCLIERHIRGGKSPQAAREHVLNVDLLNAHRIKEQICGYDVRIDKRDCVRILDVKYPSR